MIGAHWAGTMEQDGSGLYNKVINEVYKQRKIKIEIATYSRAVAVFRSGESDIIVGSYKDEFPEFHFPIYHLDMEEPVVALYDQDRLVLKNADHLSGKAVTWIEGYNFGDYLSFSYNYYPIDKIAMGIKLLDMGRIDALLDYQYNFPVDSLSRFAIQTVIPKKKIWLVFQRSERGRMLAREYDKAIKRLIQSGELEAIYGEDFEFAEFQ